MRILKRIGNELWLRSEKCPLSNLTLLCRSCVKVLWLDGDLAVRVTVVFFYLNAIIHMLKRRLIRLVGHSLCGFKVYFMSRLLISLVLF